MNKNLNVIVWIVLGLLLFTELYIIHTLSNHDQTSQQLVNEQVYSENEKLFDKNSYDRYVKNIELMSDHIDQLDITRLTMNCQNSVDQYLKKYNEQLDKLKCKMPKK